MSTEDRTAVERWEWEGGTVADTALELQISKMASNLATLNDIVYTLTAAISDDRDFIRLVKTVLEMHSNSLGFEFQRTGTTRSLFQNPLRD